jgi:hypothetical protein
LRGMISGRVHSSDESFLLALLVVRPTTEGTLGLFILVFFGSPFHSSPLSFFSLITYIISTNEGIIHQFNRHFTSPEILIFYSHSKNIYPTHSRLIIATWPQKSTPSLKPPFSFPLYLAVSFFSWTRQARSSSVWKSSPSRSEAGPHPRKSPSLSRTGAFLKFWHSSSKSFWCCSPFPPFFSFFPLCSFCYPFFY